MGYGYGRNDDYGDDYKEIGDSLRRQLSRVRDENNDLKTLLVKVQPTLERLEKQNKSLKKEIQGIASRFKESELAPWFENTIIAIEEYLNGLDEL